MYVGPCDDIAVVEESRTYRFCDSNPTCIPCLNIAVSGPGLHISEMTLLDLVDRRDINGNRRFRESDFRGAIQMTSLWWHNTLLRRNFLVKSNGTLLKKLTVRLRKIFPPLLAFIQLSLSVKLCHEMGAFAPSLIPPRLATCRRDMLSSETPTWGEQGYPAFRLVKFRGGSTSPTLYRVLTNYLEMRGIRTTPCFRTSVIALYPFGWGAWPRQDCYYDVENGGLKFARNGVEYCRAPIS